MEVVAQLIAALPDLPFLLLAVIVAAVSFFLFRGAAGTMSIYKLNIVSLTYYLWLLLMCFPGPVLSILGVENYAFRKASSQSIRMAFVSISYAMIMMPLSMIIYQKLIFRGDIREKVLSFYGDRIKPVQTEKDTAQLIFWSIVTLVCIGGVAYCYSVVPGTPVFAAISGASVTEVARLRHITTFEFPGIVYAKGLIMDRLTLVLSFVAYGYYRLYGGKKLKYWFFVSLSLVLLSRFFTGEIKPIATLAIGFIVLRGIINGGLSKKLVIYIIISSFFIIGMMTVVTGGNITLSLYGGPFARLVMSQSFGVAYVFDVFPEMHGFLYGASFPGWITDIIGVQHEKSTRILMRMFNPEGVRAGTAGVIASLFVADAYANFGMVGLLISPLVVGFILQGLHSLTTGLSKNPVTAALIPVLMFQLPIIAGFAGIVWNVGLFFILAVIAVSMEWRYVLVSPHT